MIQCVIVDDEPLAREGIASYVREIDFLQLTGTCENPLELMNILREKPVDLIFLDIQMPKMSGIDFLKMTKNPPMVILTTAYPSYAIEGFQLNVLDYLLKPITFDRFLKAAAKANDYHALLSKSQKPESGKVEPGYFFVRSGSKFEKILVDEILYIQGMQNYVTICTVRGKYVALLNMKSLEQNLEASDFIRVHKSYIVPVRKIDSIEGNEIFVQTHVVPMGRNYRDTVLERVLSNKLWEKIKMS